MLDRLRLGPLANSHFRVLWGGQSLSFLGDAVVPIALSLAVIELGASAAELGLVLAAGSLPRLIFVIVGGVFADRLRRQHVMMVANVVNMLAQVFMGFELLNSSPSFAYIALLSACSGIASAFYIPASRALLPAVVGSNQIASANTVVSISQQGALIVGPALGTLIFFSVGAGWAMIGNGLTFGISAATLACLRLPRATSERRGFLSELSAGWLEVRHRNWLWFSLVAHAVWNLGFALYQTLGPLIVASTGGGGLAWALVAQGGALGALVGAVLSSVVRPRRPLISVSVLLAVESLLLLSLAMRAALWIIVVSAALTYAGVEIMAVLWNTAIQDRTPPRTLARVASYDFLVTYSLKPVGQIFAAPMVSILGFETLLIAAAIVVAVANFIVLVSADVRNLKIEGYK